MLFVFFKQKTAYEMRISDWSSDVCSSDLVQHEEVQLVADDRPAERRAVLLGELLGLEAAILLDRRRLAPGLGRAVPEEAAPEFVGAQIGRASWWDRVCPYV